MVLSRLDYRNFTNMLRDQEIYQSLQAIDPKFTSLNQIEEIINHQAYEAAKFNFDFYRSKVKYLMVSEYPYHALRFSLRN